MTVEAKAPAQELPPRPVPPPGLTLVPTLRNIEEHYGREELEAALEFWKDEAKAAKADRLFRAELEKYEAALVAARRA